MTLLFPGSFDPFTIAHKDIAERALNICDKLIIAVGINTAKTPTFDLQYRLDMINRAFIGEQKAVVCSYNILTADFAYEQGVDAIIRGIRSPQDAEYEKPIAEFNRANYGIETLFMYSRPELEYISSSLVRELYKLDKDIKPYLPA